MFEDSEDSRDHPKMMDVVQGALRAEGFSLSSIRNSDVRHPVDGWFPYLRKKHHARHTNDIASTVKTSSIIMDTIWDPMIQVQPDKKTGKKLA